MSKKESKKGLDAAAVFVGFEDEPLKWSEFEGQKKEDRPDATLRHILLRYISFAGSSNANLSDDEKMHAYEAGRVIGVAEGRFELTQQQYDVVKKIVDDGKIKGGGQVDELFSVVFQQQAKNLINEADIIEGGLDKK